jgi:aryl-alcohol dehydrogenase-like predicted oxidoreductase
VSSGWLPEVGCRLVFGSADLRDEDVTYRLLDEFAAAGGSALDVANVYGDGDSQRAIGKWLASRRVREELVIYAKGCHPPHCSPSLVRAEVESALRLLQVDHLDVFMLHRDRPEVPAEEFAEALLEQVEAGKIGGFGVSNWTTARFHELAACLGVSRDSLVAFSNHFSLGEMVAPPWPGCLAMTSEELTELGDEGLTALAWASLAGGYFAGRPSPGWESVENDARRRRAAELAVQLGTLPAVVALAYVLHQPPHVLAVVGTRSEAHLAQALAARDLRLTAEQMSWLETGT